MARNDAARLGEAGQTPDSNQSGADAGHMLPAGGWQPGLRQAALGVLSAGNASRKEAGFLGQMCVADAPTERQLRWLNLILVRAGLPGIADRESGQ